MQTSLVIGRYVRAFERQVHMAYGAFVARPMLGQPIRALRSGRILRLAVLAVVPLGLLAACDEAFDAGATPDEQLCRALGRPGEDGTRPELRVGPLLGQVSSTGEVPVELVAVHLIVGPHRGDFDLLGEYGPFVDFANATGAFYDRDVTRSIVPTPEVEASAEAVDEALARGACD